jgi:peptidoglycan/xylan/chitin deacetylase (PgdA/CDA1 family)
VLHLLVGIDTEGDNQWDAQARASQTFENLYALPHLHELLARHGARPTYLITYPVAADPRSAGVLRSLHATGTCEIGAHHHAWETPPFAPEEVRRHPYASSLPLDRFEAQLDTLTDAIASAIGYRPVSYRSGRFGFSPKHVWALEQAGYRVESSVAPLFNEAHKGGPDFTDAPLRPYYLAYDEACEPGTSAVLEVPCSASLNRQVPRLVRRLFARAPRPYFTKRILRAAGIVRVDWLRPSYTSLDAMSALARRIAAMGEPVLNLLFHSSEAIVGGSPYNRTQGELDAFFDRLDRFLSLAIGDMGARPATFGEFATLFASGQALKGHQPKTGTATGG